MDDNVRYRFEIYIEGVVCIFKVRGTKRFLAEREFLDWLVGHPRFAGMPRRPLPDHQREGYMLTREQLRIYGEYRKDAAHTRE